MYVRTYVFFKLSLLHYPGVIQPAAGIQIKFLFFTGDAAASIT
jgi:hypothetical protein